MERYDIAIVGGGIVGLATAMALTRIGGGGPNLVVLEAENQLAAHQTGHNSGVIHAGLYYKPGSLKARFCTEGRRALYEFCREHSIPHERCGKLVVATSAAEVSRLGQLEERGRANGIEGIRRLSAEEIPEYEPHARGLAALFVPETGIVDYTQVAEAYARVITQAGHSVRTHAGVTAVRKEANGLRVATSAGELHASFLITCAGLQSDRVVRLASCEPRIRIVPFRGEYYEIRPERRLLVRHLIYPVPDPSFPFLGVHFTRKIGGSVEAGPNAVLAFKRHGYARWSFSPRDTVDTLTYPPFWKLAARHWRMGLGEFLRSGSRSTFVRALQRLVPEIMAEDLVPGGAGVRAQALDRDGNLLDDFSIIEAERMVHVLNAPSPAATASIRIGQAIAEMARRSFHIGGPGDSASS